MKAFQEVIDMPMESDTANLMEVFFFLLGRHIDIVSGERPNSS